MPKIVRFYETGGADVLKIEVSPLVEPVARGKQFVCNGLESGALKPIIHRTFPLEGIVEAHATWNPTSKKARSW